MENKKYKYEKAELCKYFVEALDKAFTNYILKFREAKDFFSESSVHDLRVAVRRLLSLISLIEGIAKSSNNTSLRKYLKAQLDMFSELRDTQVQLIRAHNLKHDYPALGLFFQFLQYRETKLIKILKAEILSIDETDIEGEIFFLKMEIKKPVLIDFFTINEININIDKTYNKLIKRYQNVNPLEPDTIHKVRIAFKPFRYKMEILRNILNLNDIIFSKFKSFQTLLGDIQDCHVFISNYNEFINKQKAFPVDLFVNSMELLKQTQEKLIEKFMTESKNIYYFKNYYEIK
ncbi:MAG: hypothetical protein QG635_252 [Bacteroidota bacterium]|nr:hypothetical protein [Bacteroidota bacterium]